MGAGYILTAHEIGADVIGSSGYAGLDPCTELRQIIAFRRKMNMMAKKITKHPQFKESIMGQVLNYKAEIAESDMPSSFHDCIWSMPPPPRLCSAFERYSGTHPIKKVEPDTPATKQKTRNVEEVGLADAIIHKT